MTAVGADERPHARDQAEDVTRSQPASFGERQLAGDRGRGDCRFSVQSNRGDSLAGSGASGCQYLVFEGEFGFASYRILIAAERVTTLEIRRHRGKRRMRRRLIEFDGYYRRAILQLVDHLNGTSLAECPVAPRQVVERGLLGD